MPAVKRLPALAHERCFALWLELGSFPEVAKATSYPVASIKNWSHREGWPERKAKIIARVRQATEDNAASIIASERAPIMRRHIRMSKRLMDAAEQLMDGSSSVPSRDLADAARITKAAADIAAQVIGLDQSNRPDVIDGKAFSFDSIRRPSIIDAAFDELPTVQQEAEPASQHALGPVETEPPDTDADIDSQPRHGQPGPSPVPDDPAPDITPPAPRRRPVSAGGRDSTPLVVGSTDITGATSISGSHSNVIE